MTLDEQTTVTLIDESGAEHLVLREMLNDDPETAADAMARIVRRTAEVAKTLQSTAGDPAEVDWNRQDASIERAVREAFEECMAIPGSRANALRNIEVGIVRITRSLVRT